VKKEYQNDVDVVLAAIQQNPKAIGFASKEIKEELKKILTE